MVDGRSVKAGSRRERAIRKIASLLVMAVYRRVEVYRTLGQTMDRPQLSVANHFGGFADPLLLVYALPRMPRIIARDVIWKIPVVGWVMRWIGAIPVHKSEDRGPGSNQAMFASAYEALAEHAHVMIFPEGITRDEPSIAPIKTGAARIALGARSSGVEGIQITPVGIHYEDKAALRSDVSILVGASLDLDVEVGELVRPDEDASPSNREAVRALTDDIEHRLRHVAPDFEDWTEARSMTRGAEILMRAVARDPTAPVSLASRDYIAGYLGRKPAAEKQAIRDAVDGYEMELSDLGITDAELVSGMTGRRFLLRLIGWLVLSLVVLPFAVVGVLINWIPFLIVKGVGRLRVAPAVMATIKPMSAIFSFGITWAIVTWGAFRGYGWIGATLVLLLLPLYLAAAIFLAERAVMIWRAFRTWRRLARSSGASGTIDDLRRDVVALLSEAL